MAFILIFPRIVLQDMMILNRGESLPSFPDDISTGHSCLNQPHFPVRTLHPLIMFCSFLPTGPGRLVAQASTKLA